MDTKICAITGATSGIGRATGFELGKHNTQLILMSRNEIKGNSIVHKLRSFHREDKACFIQTDISNFDEVKSAAHQIKSRYPRIDVLINNAGARFNTLRKNENGIELTFATNHLGHFLLTLNLLRPRV